MAFDERTTKNQSIGLDLDENNFKVFEWLRLTVKYLVLQTVFITRNIINAAKVTIQR